MKINNVNVLIKNILKRIISSQRRFAFKKYLSVDRIKSLFQNRKSAKDAFEAKTSNGGGKLIKIKCFFEQESQTWDYCLFSKSMHKSFLSKASRLQRNYYVLVGHPKSFVGGDGLEYLLNKTKDKYAYVTIGQIVINLIK